MIGPVKTIDIIAGILYAADGWAGKDADFEKIEEGIDHWYKLKKSLEEEPWRWGKHSGDCTKQCHTCNRCLVEQYQVRALELLNKEQD